MRLIKARVQNYRSIMDTGWFELENDKTILVGPNEAGKTAVLQALQKLNAPPDVKPFDALRDYPRSKYNDITTGKVDPSNVVVVEGKFKIEPSDNIDLPPGYENCVYVFTRKLDNKATHNLEKCPATTTYKAIIKDLKRMASHVDKMATEDESTPDKVELFAGKLATITEEWSENSYIVGEKAESLSKWLDSLFTHIDETNSTEEERFDRLKNAVSQNKIKDEILSSCYKKLPLFVYFNNYSRVKPLIHLEQLANRIEQNNLLDEYYDYGNICLLKLLGFNARDLSNLGKATAANSSEQQIQSYRDQLDKRQYQLNAASVRLTEEIRKVWMPDRSRNEADRLRVAADGQYLKVVVEDDLGVEIELDQRSEGFQWLVSFFIVFFAEAEGKHANAILLLDEPGLNLHALKQSDFRQTISKLGESNQTVYTTHSPFMVGANELDLVRVVEMTDRYTGTKVHTTITANDSNAMLPLQEALGYDLAQSLFTQQRNLVFEGLTDYWYIESISEMLRNDGIIDLNKKIALIPAGTASKVVYYATILRAQNLKVAALFDSDPEGEQAAKQDTLVNLLQSKSILQIKDFYTGTSKKVEVEDLLRETLVKVARTELDWDVADIAEVQVGRPIADIFASQISEFSKYQLAKAFLRWSRNNDSQSLTETERRQWKALIEQVNKALK
ncbi:AAA family ATPase [Cohnella zeiphila]|uniref:AAA family ATPase n=1 Tax=Cohnella zeiphila TaxID=2761120 RepID=A0A7X0SMF8_9BACL|nr:AAA family ATPase [Cohnella zeiphila]MBB6731400.1 AAA family ATPase [Cohnella zeiphila]